MSDPHTTCPRGWRNCTNCYEVCTETAPCTYCQHAADSPPLRGEVVAELNGDLLLRIIEANRDNPHRPCDCGSRAPNCEVCDERWPCPDATVAQVLAKPYLNARPHGQPDPWREGYNQALREVRDTLMEGNHE